jgi:hypothetical protein
VVTNAVAELLKVEMQKPDFVFVTPYNQAKIEARIGPAVKAEMARQQAVADESAAFEKRRIDDAVSKHKQ